MKANWSVTYEVVSEESAEHGEAEEQGFILKDVPFREAMREFGEGAEDCDECPIRNPRWFNVCWQDYKTGYYHTNSLHVPDQITTSSRIRLARYLGLARQLPSNPESN